jgi:hypothetical protein
MTRTKIWMLFLIMATCFVAVSLSVDCPPTNISPTPIEADPNQINYKLLCVRRAVEGSVITVTASACDEDGELLGYRILQGPPTIELVPDANEVTISWIGQRGIWYVDIEVFDYPPEPNDTACDRGSIIFIVRKKNQPPIFGGCR